VVKAIQDQAARFIHMSGTDFYYPQMAELAERLARTFPGGGEAKVYFGNSGTEAMEAALKLARYYTGRDKFIAFYGCFHGRTMGALSLTSSKKAQRYRFGPLVPGVFHAPYPNAYRRPVRMSEEEQAHQSIVFIEQQLFHAVAPPEEVAAIVVEPFQGEGGYLFPPASFLQELRHLCDRHGILLVVDEVQCGMGRTGKMWACEHSGVAPDILCSSKGIASGMPLSATIARAEVMSWKPGAHASTFGGNPVSIAAALATLDLLEGGLIEQAAATGRYILEHIADWPRRHTLVGDVRGKGLMVAIDLVRNKDSKEPAHEERDRLVQMAFQRGVLLLGAGDSALRLMPPLTVGRDQVDFALDVIVDCLKRL
jgi:4-aminobutyrate aminotransferase